ncbi:MAG: hypothetical protein Q8O34_15705 [Rhodocyclaceae bacterium]|nr:hypothetical protein [Rhodocyclaceae bacterium]
MGLDDLIAHQRMTRQALLEKQRRDLAGIIEFAKNNTDYYRDRFAGLDEQPPEALPILRKEDVVANLDALLARGAQETRGDAAKLGYTGGSTGKPMAFWYNEAKHALMRAGMARSYMMSGWRPGQRIVNFWGARRDIGAGGVFDNTDTEHTLPAQEYDEATLDGWAHFVRSYRPVLLQGYASILAELARFVIDNRIEMPDTLIGIYSTAEVLDERQRELMERAFSCPVFNQYGSREIPNIACECRHGGMHVFTDMVFLESHAVRGEDRLLVTSLTNRLMPMIRYDIGDSVRLKEGLGEVPCPCGSPFPLMEMGLCRKNDFIRSPGGRRVHPSYFNRLLYGMTQIRQYQWIQDAPDRIVLNVVAAPGLSPEIVDSLRESIRRDVDARMTLEFNPVEEIARTVSGKHRFVISHLA